MELGGGACSEPAAEGREKVSLKGSSEGEEVGGCEEVEREDTVSGRREREEVG